MNHIPDTPDKKLDLTYRANMPKVGEGENGKWNAFETALNMLKNN